MSQLAELQRIKKELGKYVETRPKNGKVTISFNRKEFTLNFHADLYDSLDKLLDEQIEQEL